MVKLRGTFFIERLFSSYIINIIFIQGTDKMMFKEILSSHAENLTKNNCMVISNIPLDHISITPFIEKEKLHILINEKLGQLEQTANIQFSNNDLIEISELISLVPATFNEKDVYEYRLQSLNNILYISTELDKLNSCVEEQLQQKVEQLAALLKICSHGPHRHLLEERIKSVKTDIEGNSKEEVDLENLVSLVNRSNSVEDIDEVFCELLIESYVNLGEKRRLAVAEQFLRQLESYTSAEQILEKLNILVTKFIENNPIDDSEQTKIESHKRTINKNELEFINRDIHG